MHYDYQIRWQNFRGFRDTDWIKIAPLTVVLGANNSGKSSLFAPLLMMRQTMASRDSDTSLITRGRNIDIGFFKDYVFKKETDRKITLAFKYHTHPRPSDDDLDELGSYAPGMFEATFQHLGPNSDVDLLQYKLWDIYEREMLKLQKEDNSFKISGKLFKDLTDAERTAIGQCEPINFLFSPTSALYFLQSEDRKKKDPDGSIESSKLSDSFSEFLRATSFSFEEIRNKLEDIYYIGPHRDYPKRIYEYFGDRPYSVGKEGEYFASIVKRDRETVLPKINDWLKKLEIGDELRVDDLSDNLFSLRLKTSGGGEEYNLADLGFGISQIIPVIVQAVSAEASSLTIIEQPELHLNPKLQRNLADLFVDAANSDKRIVVETHSEHMLLRLRVLLARGRILPQNVAVYFVERRGTSSSIRKIDLDKFGHIDPEQWPKDFFSENLEGALELAQAQRRAVAQSG